MFYFVLLDAHNEVNSRSHCIQKNRTVAVLLKAAFGFQSQKKSSFAFKDAKSSTMDSTFFGLHCFYFQMVLLDALCRFLRFTECTRKAKRRSKRTGVHGMFLEEV